MDVLDSEADCKWRCLWAMVNTIGAGNRYEESGVDEIQSFVCATIPSPLVPSQTCHSQWSLLLVSSRGCKSWEDGDHGLFSGISIETGTMRSFIENLTKGR